MILKKKKLRLIIGIIAIVLCPAIVNPHYTLVKASILNNMTDDEEESMDEAVNKAIPKDAVIIAPQGGKDSKGIILKDINGDGKDEIIVLYRYSGDKGRAAITVLKKAGNRWNKILNYKSEGTEVHYIALGGITGKDKNDIVVGWKIGSIFNEINIFSWNGKSLKKIYDDYYSKIKVEDMPDNNGNMDGKSEIALWKHDTSEAYIVDVIRWEDSKMVLAKDVYSYYFKRVTRFYENRVKELPDAAFYWYYLADAQIKAGYLNEAKISVEKGLSIKSEHPDYYPSNEKFEELYNTIKSLLEN